MLPRGIFEILPAVMAILVLFKHFSGKLCLKFLTLILSISPYMMHFVRTFSIVRAEGVRLIRRGSKLWKICIIKNIVEIG